MTIIETDADWEAAANGVREGNGPAELVLDLDGYEGPIDVLLALARQQKVDLTRISILRLSEQYLEFIVAARRVNLELAADYLVMAAWLVYLKSRLLLPVEAEDDEEPSGPELAQALTFQLRRLEGMQDSGNRLMARPRLGRDVFGRGDPEGFEVVKHPVFEISLFDLLSSYGENRRRLSDSVLRIEPSDVHSTADALVRLSSMIGGMTEWKSLLAYLPKELADGLAWAKEILNQ